MLTDFSEIWHKMFAHNAINPLSLMKIEQEMRTILMCMYEITFVPVPGSLLSRQEAYSVAKETPLILSGPYLIT